jgi:FKBP-type peptidyl-prolyl cis-trans isomerase
VEATRALALTSIKLHHSCIELASASESYISCQHHSNSQEMFALRRTLTPSTISRQITRNFSNSAARMGVTKTIIRKGDGASPQKGDKVTIEYTGWIKDTTKPDNKGSQ